MYTANERKYILDNLKKARREQNCTRNALDHFDLTLSHLAQLQAENKKLREAIALATKCHLPHWAIYSCSCYRALSGALTDS